MAQRRYNAKIQRAKGLLEIAAAMFDTSLSFATRRAAESALQTDSRVGYGLALALRASPAQGAKGVSLSFAADSFRELRWVGEKKISLAWVNPSVAATLAYRGTGPFKRPLPLRAIAVFPSYDVVGFAVHESLGIASLTDIKEKKIPLRLATRETGARALAESPTMFTVAAVMQAAGFTVADLRRWGGKIHSVERPSDPRRRAAIADGTVSAVFDEGIKSWGQTALDHGFRYVPIEGTVLRRLARMGYRPSYVPKKLFRGMNADVQTVDFSGWPMVVHKDMPNDVAYAICEAIAAKRAALPTDNFKPLRLAQLSA
ncbi:MAG TPA: TAXI family TRAP transporter solute-binding subunit, partial [Candidatus Binatia bacterium]|nr:TAXI family TRAP transporter solute-binding subunit [Candidatus Binatia bacterium]